MTPTRWAQAVEAMRGTPGCKDTGGGSHFPELCRQCLDLKARAATPHLLRAVTEEMGPGELEMLASTLYSYLCGANVYPESLPASRTALLAALTDAAGRVGT